VRLILDAADNQRVVWPGQATSPGPVWTSKASWNRKVGG